MAAEAGLSEEASRGGAQLEPSNELGQLCIPTPTGSLGPSMHLCRTGWSDAGPGTLMPYQYSGGGGEAAEPRTQDKAWVAATSLGDSPTVTKVHW